MKRIKDHSLYLVISEDCCRGRSALAIAERAIAGGVDIIQMREKRIAREKLLELGRKLAGLCKRSGAIFIVNDDPALAKDTGADGVHLGKEDLNKYPVSEARRIMGGGRIVGLSTHSVEEAGKAAREDADYIAFGPVFQTPAKGYSVGTKDIPRVLGISGKPVFFIGGINLENIGEVISKGARNVAVARAISEAEDIADAARKIKAKLDLASLTRLERNG